mgnify:CR=1 FL=1
MHPPIKTYARILTRPLSARKQRLMDEKLPQISALEQFTTKSCDFDKIALEIGFGNGKHFIDYAKNNPDTLCIGAEPYLNGVAQVLTVLYPDEKQPLYPNLLIHPSDARELFDLFKNKKLDKIFILYPDPWPKARHHKKRLINEQFLSTIADVLKEDGTLEVMTDHADYADWIKNAIENCKDVNLKSHDISDSALISSKYENRGLAMDSKLNHFVVAKNKLVIS